MANVSELKDEGMKPSEIVYYLVEMEGEALSEAVSRVARFFADEGFPLDQASLKREAEHLLGVEPREDVDAPDPDPAPAPESPPRGPSGTPVTEEALLSAAFNALHEHKRRDLAIQTLLRAGVDSRTAHQSVDRVLQRLRKGKIKKCLEYAGGLVVAILVVSFVIYAEQEEGVFYWYLALAGGLGIPYTIVMMLWTPFRGIRAFEGPEDLMPELGQGED